MRPNFLIKRRRAKPLLNGRIETIHMKDEYLIVNRQQVRSLYLGASMLGGCGATNPPIEEVGPTVVLQAAFDGEQGVGARLRSAAPRPLESAADDLLADAFHDAETDQQSELSVEVVAHSVRVGLVGSGYRRRRPRTGRAGAASERR